MADRVYPSGRAAAVSRALPNLADLEDYYQGHNSLESTYMLALVAEVRRLAARVAELEDVLSPEDG